MIDVASPAHRSCVTVDSRRRLRAGCTETDRNTVGLQELCVCMSSDQRQRCGVTLVPLHSHSFYIAQAATVH